MGVFKKNPFGHYLFLKRWLIRIAGSITHRRYRGFNELQIEGSDIIKELPESNVLFISNPEINVFDGNDRRVDTIKYQLNEFGNSEI